MNPTEQPYLSVIIPAYNAAHLLPATLVAIDKYLSGAGFSYEIIVNNDGSKDNTAEVVRNMTSSVRNLRLIDNEANKGKGGVVRQGMLAAKGSIRLFMDDDNSTSIDQFEKMRPYFEQGYDVVIASRAIKGSIMRPAQPWFRRIPGRLSNLVIQLVNLPGIWDTQCGFKAFSAASAQRIFELSRISAWGFDIEVLSLARMFGYKIKEVPAVWINQTESRVKASAYLTTFIENLQIRWWIITGAYGKTSNQ